MRKRQKLILIFYVFCVFLVTFIIEPLSRYGINCSKTYLGHHLRPTILQFLGLEQYGSSAIVNYVSIDAPVMIAEVISLTAIAVALFLLTKQE
ncbi:MAG: hypothetical protein HZB61_13375 [Nitrospirae bacterium]|nr:hypothetical protein [Nitrospirota bacterium]